MTEETCETCGRGQSDLSHDRDAAEAGLLPCGTYHPFRAASNRKRRPNEATARRLAHQSLDRLIEARKAVERSRGVPRTSELPTAEEEAWFTEERILSRFTARAAKEEL